MNTVFLPQRENCSLGVLGEFPWYHKKDIFHFTAWTSLYFVNRTPHFCQVILKPSARFSYVVIRVQNYPLLHMVYGFSP